MKPSEITVCAFYARSGKAGQYVRKVCSIGEAPLLARLTNRRLWERQDAVGYLEARPTGYIASSPEYCLLATFARWAEREVQP